MARVLDVAVALDDTYPAVVGWIVRPSAARGSLFLPRDEISRVVAGRLSLRTALGGGQVGSALLLRRDVLDAQIVDVRERRIARVGDVHLAWDDDLLRVVAVDVGWRAILHRLGLRRVARRVGHDAIDWASVHLASARNQPLQLSAPTAAVHRLDASELAELLVRLPTDRGAEVLDTVEGARAAAALAAVHPDLGADLVEALPLGRAGALLAQMPDDDAADALAQADDDRRAALLDRMPPTRSVSLRRTLRADGHG